MSQHGVTLPTFTPRTTTPGQSPPSSRPPGAGAGRGAGGAGGGVSAAFANPADQTAVKACQGVLPSAFVAQMQARANQLAAFDSCMADHGVTVPKASPGTPPTTLDTSSAAYKTCSPLLPTRPQNAGSGSTTTVPAGA
jgi:hypothetical protein